MKDLFTKHSSAAGETYTEHLVYAYKMGWRLYFLALRMVVASLFFTVHAIFPFIGVPKYFNLSSMGAEGKKLYDEGIKRDDQRRKL